jgi:hypothetical protein
MLNHEWIKDGKHHPLLNDLQYACDTPYEFTVLDYLFRCDWNSEIGAIPSLKRLEFNNMMCHETVVKSLKGLEDKGYISRGRSIGKSNKYTIHFDVIEQAIIHRTPFKDSKGRTRKMMSDKQMSGATVSNGIRHPELANRIADGLGMKLVPKNLDINTGELKGE